MYEVYEEYTWKSTLRERPVYTLLWLNQRALSEVASQFLLCWKNTQQTCKGVEKERGSFYLPGPKQVDIACYEQSNVLCSWKGKYQM
jgi:hypothetical protein